MTRKYEQRRRADQQEETRQRIIRAAVELHAIDGPARTSMSAVAERAGVQRNTLYRHFADEQTLTQACSGLFIGENPLPDPSQWLTVEDPAERARKLLAELYAYWESTEAMYSNVLRDAEYHEPTRLAVAATTDAALAEMRDTIASAWPRGTRRKRLVAAAELAVAFRTWQSLVRRSGMTTSHAVDLMVDLVEAAA